MRVSFNEESESKNVQYKLRWRFTDTEQEDKFYTWISEQKDQKQLRFFFVIGVSKKSFEVGNVKWKNKENGQQNEQRGTILWVERI